jgi:hypothetical protein
MILCGAQHGGISSPTQIARQAEANEQMKSKAVSVLINTLMLDRQRGSHTGFYSLIVAFAPCDQLEELRYALPPHIC